ncbi:hypothetical protein MKW92_004101 [Papaver armeniacum]|nr:hypothetical protein MKW92_004101 [Papaver armeniacum]
MEGETVGRMKLGSQGFEVSKQGLGCMGMSASYGPAKPDSDMIALIHHAIDKGITFLDTSDIYGPYTNEVLIGKAIVDKRDKVELATKFGATFENGSLQIYGNPEYVRAACEASLKRLKLILLIFIINTELIPKFPSKLLGKIKYIGLSEAFSTIRRAHAVHPITAVQLEWSLWSRDIEKTLELGIGIVAYSPLGRGFYPLVQKLVDNLADNDYRKSLPRFLPENLEHNQHIFERVNELASKKGCTFPSLHWRGCIIKETLFNISALSVKLTASELAELESLASADAVKGDRYSRAHAWTWKNSDTPELSSS